MFLVDFEVIDHRSILRPHAHLAQASLPVQNGIRMIRPDLVDLVLQVSRLEFLDLEPHLSRYQLWRPESQPPSTLHALDLRFGG